MSLSDWIRPRRRLWAIYNELGYIPWRKPRKKRVRRQRRGVYFGTLEAIPFVNDDAKRTFAHLLLRPGYMMRDYIVRGQHERYLAPFTAMLVFYSVFTLIVAVVKPGERDSFGDALLSGFEDLSFESDSLSIKFSTSEGDASPVLVPSEESTAREDVLPLPAEVQGNKSLQVLKLKRVAKSILRTSREAILLTRLDKHPDAADTTWKKSLAAIEGDLRSKGVPLFLGSFLILWLSMAVLLRRHGISGSGAAAASGYILCQYCIFMFLELLLSFGRNTDLGLLLVAVLLFIDYRQLLGIKVKPALRLTIKTGLLCLLFQILFYLLVGIGLVVFALYRM